MTKRQGFLSRSLIAFALSVALALLTATASFASTTAVSQRTRVVVYSPFTIGGTLAKGVRIVRSVSGSCWTGSLASARSDAWRCMSGNQIHDPCYSGAAAWVACPITAFGSKVIRLRLTRSLPRNGNRPLNTNTANPAQIVLLHGVTCGLSTGATGTVAGLRLNYACSNGAWLLGGPDRGSPLWRILYLPSLKTSQATSVPIITAWW